MVVSPIVLEGAHVRLEPLAKSHLAGLAEAGLDEELWKWIPIPVRTHHEMAAYIETSVNRAESDHADALLVVINTPGGISTSMDQIVTDLLNSSVPVIAYVYPRGVALPFAIVEKATGRVIGSTRYGNIDRGHHRVEIGWTWVARDWQRTAVNTEAKYLLLKHAFETLGCMRVEFKTDSLNERSRAAILRLGAREEGIFRNHMITASGRIRHTVYFSIIDSEWPVVKGRLEAKLNSHKRQAPQVA